MKMAGVPYTLTSQGVNIFENANVAKGGGNMDKRKLCIAQYRGLLRMS